MHKCVLRWFAPLVPDVTSEAGIFHHPLLELTAPMQSRMFCCARYATQSTLPGKSKLNLGSILTEITQTCEKRINVVTAESEVRHMSRLLPFT